MPIAGDELFLVLVDYSLKFIFVPLNQYIFALILLLQVADDPLISTLHILNFSFPLQPMLFVPIFQLKLKQHKLVVECLNLLVFAMDGFQEIVFIIEKLVNDVIILSLVELKGGPSVFGQRSLAILLQQLLTTCGTADCHSSVCQIHYSIVLNKIQVFEHQNQLFLSQSEYVQTGAKLAKPYHPITSFLMSPYLLLHLYQAHLIRNCPDLRLNLQSILLDQFIYPPTFLLNSILELIKTLQHHCAVQDIYVGSIRKQKLKNLHLNLIQILLAFHFLTNLHHLQMPQVSQQEIRKGERPLASGFFLLHHAYKLMFP